MKRVLAAVVILAAFALPAFAQGEAMIGINGGFVIPVGSFKDNYTTGGAFDVFISGPITTAIDWRFEFGYSRAGASDDFKDRCFAASLDCGPASSKRYLAGMQYHFRIDSSAVPYAFFMVGAFNTTQDARRLVTGQFLVDADQSRTDFGISFGFGARWFLGESWGVGGNVRGNGVFVDRQNNLWDIEPNGEFFLTF